MSKRLLLALLLLTSSAFATTTVSGNIKDLTGTAVSSNTFVRFYLRGCSGNQPRINGTALIAPTFGNVYYKDFVPNASGVISGTLYSTRDAAGTGNGEIECGGVFTGVWYGMVAFQNGKAGPETPVHAKNGVTLDISNVTALSTNPVITAPAGDTTYLRLDGTNSPATGAITFNGTTTFAGAITDAVGQLIGFQRNGSPPNLVDVGISHCSGAGTLCIGNGTAADGSGSLTAGAVNVTGNTNGDTALKVTPGTAGLTNASFVTIEPNSTIVGSGPQNGQPNTPQGWYRSLVGASSVGTEAGQFALSIPSGYTGGNTIAQQNNALGSYLWTQDANHYALAASFFAVCDATNAFCWGANPVVTTYSGNPTHTGQTLHGIEVDCEANTTGVTIYCLQAGAPASTQNPTTAIAFDVAAPAWPNGHWTNGLTIEQGATGATNPGIKLAPAAAGASQQSQFINFVGTNGASANVSANVGADANGDLLVTPTAGAHLRLATASAGIQLLNSTAANFTTVTAPNATTARSITWPDASGNAVIDTATQTLTNKNLTAPQIGGETISQAPRMSMGNFVPGISSVTSFGVFMVTEQPITITRLMAFAQTPAAGCGTFPVVSVFDNGGASIVTSITLGTGTLTDSGAISVNVAAGKTLIFRTTTAAVTCSPNAANVNVVVQWKMQ